jgi:hypothetical protein
MIKATSILMTRDEIRAEMGWSDDMVRRLLRIPDAPASTRGKCKCDRYNRERVLAVAKTTHGRAAKREWDETLRDPTPNPGWTPRLGDIGRLVGISAVAVGKILELLGYRSEGSVTDSAVTAGCGIRRWDGFTLFYDWQLDRVLGAIRLAAEDPGTSAVAHALAAAIAKQNARDRIAACKRRQQETEAAGRQEEEELISGLEVELRALRATDPGMGLLTAVEYITSDPAARIVLYRRCNAENHSIGSSVTGQDDPGLSTIACSVARDLALLERRARSEGFQIYRPRARGGHAWPA